VAKHGKKDLAGNEFAFEDCYVYMSGNTIKGVEINLPVDINK
jgi:hypothetical protein